MKRYSKSLLFYKKTFKRRYDKHNKVSKLPDYFLPLIGDKKVVKIAELGAGPINTIGNYLEDIDVTIVASDILQKEYYEFWKGLDSPIVPIEYQDMENLDYEDNSFDIVHCVNAVDHTKSPKTAILEMIRVCKPGGYIYLRHAENQKTRFGGIHSYDIRYINEDMCFCLKDTICFSVSDLGNFTTTKENDLVVSILEC